MGSERLEHLLRFYSMLDRLEKNIGGARTLADCSGRCGWPKRGVYFFREPGQSRTDTGEGSRVVRVGTHALKTESGTKLWTRLSQHKGQLSTGGGNHRGSIFRLIVGAALISRDGYEFPTWGDGNTSRSEVRDGELALEREVSQVIGKMPFLWTQLKTKPVRRAAAALSREIRLLFLAITTNLGSIRRRRYGSVITATESG